MKCIERELWCIWLGVKHKERWFWMWVNASTFVFFFHCILQQQSIWQQRRREKKNTREIEIPKKKKIPITNWIETNQWNEETSKIPFALNLILLFYSSLNIDGAGVIIHTVYTGVQCIHCNLFEKHVHKFWWKSFLFRLFYDPQYPVSFHSVGCVSILRWQNLIRKVFSSFLFFSTVSHFFLVKKKIDQQSNHFD